MALRRPNYRSIALKIVSGGLGLFFLACVAVTVEGLQDNPHSADVGVVLGTKVNGDGTASVMLQARLDQTAYLYRRGFFKVILVSGGHGREGYDEPAVMRRYLERTGVPSASIFEDDGGKTTWDTAKDTALFLRAHHLESVLVISQYFHIPRYRLAFQKFGITRVYWSHARFWNIRDFYSVPREVFGLIEYGFRPHPRTAAPLARSANRSDLRLSSN